MRNRGDERDQKFHHYHSTPSDDEKSGIRCCVSHGKPIVIGAECMDCAIEHLGTAAAGRMKWA